MKPVGARRELAELPAKENSLSVYNHIDHGIARGYSSTLSRRTREN